MLSPPLLAARQWATLVTSYLLSIQSQSYLTALSVWSTFLSFFCAAPQPTSQAYNLLSGVNYGRDNVPLVA